MIGTSPTSERTNALRQRAFGQHAIAVVPEAVSALSPHYRGARAVTPAPTIHEAERLRRELGERLAAIPTSDLRELITRSLHERRLVAANQLIAELDRRARAIAAPSKRGWR